MTLVPQDLDRFWESAFQASGSSFSPLSESVETYRAGGPYPRCAGLTTADFEQGVVYCPSPEFVAYEDGGANARLRDSIGDFSVGVLFADRWGQALQHRLGLSTDGEAASLQRDCLTGAWVGRSGAPADAPAAVLDLARRPGRGRADVPRLHRGRRCVR